MGSYRSGGDCPEGSSENPTCLSQLELAADGSGSFIGDDIVERATWSVAGDRVTVTIGARTLTLQAGPDGTLIDEHGIIWTPKKA